MDQKTDQLGQGYMDSMAKVNEALAMLDAVLQAHRRAYVAADSPQTKKRMEDDLLDLAVRLQAISSL